VGSVLQEGFLFSGTIRENIAIRDPCATLGDVVDAARKSGAHEFISRLAFGYETKVGERGLCLSGGQRQRIGLARALLPMPDILVLDEATSALDAESERHFQDGVRHAAAQRTTLVIAHRLSTVREADRILVMDQGRIVQDGSHEQLMQQQGLYRRLVQAQLA
jgi:ABC-type multidrug transport system fused ATPase/permease subunit